MYALNFERLGKPELKRPYLFGVLLAVVVFIMAKFIVKEKYDDFFRFLNIVIALLFFSGQKNLFVTFITEDGPRANFKIPLLIRFGVIFILFVTIVVGIKYGAIPI